MKNEKVQNSKIAENSEITDTIGKMSMNAAREYMDPKDVDCVIYHFPCADGFGAYFAAKFNLERKIKYIGLNYDKECPYIEGKNILVVDFSFKREKLEELRQKNRVMILDHHLSAQMELKNVEGAFFDIYKSGAVLAWEYFSDDKVPYFLELIQDIDLWKFKLEDSEAFNIVLKMHPFRYKTFLEYYNEWALQKTIQKGRIILEYNNSIILSESKKAQKRILSTPIGSKYVVKVLNSSAQWLASQIGSKITNGSNEIALLWFYNHKSEQYIVSLRASDTLINVGEIAEQFGGGGHKGAGAFSLDKHVDTILENF